ncbi:MAG: tetratricopeptide repeat protein [Pseudomonadota bacterium]
MNAAKADRIRVFCSHNSIDKPRVKAVAEELAAAGIDPWVDQWEIAPGDDIVAKINEGLSTCGVGLIFFSRETLEKDWVRGEVSSLTYQAIEDGKPVIPVMLDADAPVPELLRPRARVASEDLDQLIDAIYGRSGKPTVSAPRANARERQFRIQLMETADASLRVVARLDEQVVAEETTQLGSGLQRSYQEFLATSLPITSRMQADEQARRRDQDLTRLGETLGKALLPGAVGSELAAAIDRAGVEGEQLRLVFEASPALLALPFEAAHLPDGRVAALEPGVQVLRCQSGVNGPEVIPQAGPLRILVAVGAPDEGQTENVVLDYERELQTILDVMDHARRYGNAEVKILEVGHPEEIRRALLERSYHVLHVSGHGRAGVIELEDEDGRAVEVTPKALADAIRASNRPFPLIFLAACLSGVGDSDTTSFAQGLLGQGVPMVLAMQTSVSDWYATRLAGAFYNTLSRMETPLASRALALARLDIEHERREALTRGEQAAGLAAEWATPALFAVPDEKPLLDRALPQEPIADKPPLPPVGAMPMLRMDELIGRRPALRRVAGVLRDDERLTNRLGRRAGVLIRGIGGVGKSALAGRVMARLADDGWTVVAIVGRWNLGELASSVGAQLFGSANQALEQIGRLLIEPELSDSVRFEKLQSLLASYRVLLVLDNFEDNLTLGGNRFLDDATGMLLAGLLEAANEGKILITCRYPIPDSDAWVADEHLGPLSAAETRKLFYRLHALTGAVPETLGLILRHIGGHPRMLEYVDAILRRGEARLPMVTRRLRENAKRLGLDPKQLGGDLEQSMRDALRVGAEDVLLDELIELVGAQPEDLEALHQCAAFALPVDVHGLAFALAGAEEPTADQVKAADASARRLIATSLLTPLPEDHIWVHRWTAQELHERLGEPGARECARRAGEYRAWRVANIAPVLSDAVESVRRFLEAHAFDRAIEMARPILGFMERYGQRVDVAGFAAEILESLPTHHLGYYNICGSEADALMALGATERAKQRYEEANDICERLARAEPDRADYQRNLAVSYNKLGGLYRAFGQGEAAHTAFQNALEIVERLARAEPERADYQRDLAVSYNKLGDLYRDLGQGEATHAAFRNTLEIVERLARAEPERADYQRDLAVSYSRIGDLHRDLGQGEAAREAIQNALEIAKRLARAEPDRADYQRDLAVSYNKMGDLYRALGQGEAAREAYQKDLEITERLARAEPERADYQRDLSVSYNRIGDLYRALGQGEAAREAFQKDLEIAERLAHAEPDRADYQRDLAISYNKMGDMYRALGQGEAAREAFQNAFEIAERLARAEPDHTNYQRDLTISYNKMGDLYRALGQGEAAREAFQNALEITERLAHAEPDHANYQRDLAISYNKMGDLYRDLGQREAAREAIQNALEIAERLAHAEPERADYRRDIAVCYNKMGDLYRDLGQEDAAREAFQNALEIVERLGRAEPERADYQRDIAVSYNKIGDLYRDLGQEDAARDAYQRDLEIAERLARAEPERADYQRDLSVSYNRIGDLYRALGQGEAAREAFQKDLEIAERLARGEPERADYQRDLAVSCSRMGSLYRDLGQNAAARDAFRNALEIQERLLRTEPERADYQRDLAICCNKMGDVYRDVGQMDAAHDAYQKSLEIAEHLARTEPEHAEYQRDLSVSYTRMGDLYRDLGKEEAALEAYQKDLEIAERLARAEPERADYQWDLVVSLVRFADPALLGRALTILRTLDDAGSLNPDQRDLITRLEDQLARKS